MDTAESKFFATSESKSRTIASESKSETIAVEVSERNFNEDLCASVASTSIKKESPESLRRVPSFFAEYELCMRKPVKETSVAEKAEKSEKSFESAEEEELEAEEQKITTVGSISEVKEDEKEYFAEAPVVAFLKPQWKIIKRRMIQPKPQRRYVVTYVDENDEYDDRRCHPYFNYLKKMVGKFLVRGTATLNLDRDGCPLAFLN